VWWVGVALAQPAVEVVEDESSWPEERRGALRRAVATCVKDQPWVGTFYVTLGGDQGGRTAEFSVESFEELPIFACLGPALTGEAEVRDADEAWWAMVRVGPDPAWLSTVTLADPPAELADAVRLRIALCAAGQAYAGSLVVELEKDPDQLFYQYAWPSPVTPAGEAIGQCVRGWAPGSLKKAATVVATIKTAQQPARAPVTVTPGPDTPATVAEAVRDAVAQCAAVHAFSGPFQVGLNRSKGALNGYVSAMAEGAVMPSMDLGNCITFGRYPEIPEGAAYSFEVAPKG
jgi:hypothetical protein